jgi:hypothetical protein
MKRLSRVDIVKKICRLANLPDGKGTNGYFTRKQLIELMLRMENASLQGGEKVNAQIEDDDTKER